MSNENTIKTYNRLTMKGKVNSSAHASDQIYGKVAAYPPQSLEGKMQRKAIMLLCYGAGIKRAAKVSGLSLRRVKVIAKQPPTL